MGALVESSHQDVRKFLAESLANAESPAFQEHGFDLLIDEDPNVRAATIRSFGVAVNRLVENYGTSLLDDEYVIQRAAMDVNF